MFEIIGIKWHWLGPTESESSQGCDDRNEDGANRVDMFDWIEGQSTLQARRWITEVVGHIAVRNFVNNNREDQDDQRYEGEHNSV